MTRFINTALIVVLAFFLSLVVLWRAAVPQDADALSIRDVTVHWGRADAQGTDLLVGFTLRNPGSMQAQDGVLAIRASANGQVLAQDLRAVPFDLRPNSDATVQATLRLPADFPTTWWRAYAAGGEASRMRINGTLEVRAAYRVQSVPFEWVSPAPGDLPQQLSQGSGNCGVSPPGLCAASVEAAWDQGALRATVHLRNTGPAQVLVRNGTLAVRFAGATVASGPLLAPAAVAAGSDATVQALATFDAEQLQAWWPGHVGRCESSPANLTLSLVTSTEGNATLAPGANPPSAQNATLAPVEVTSTTWDLPASPFATRLVCPPAR